MRHTRRTGLPPSTLGTAMQTLLRRLVCTVGVLFVTGCWSWRPTSPGEDPAPAAVKVRLSDHSVVYVRGARLEGDSVLVGRGPTSEALQIPLRDIASVTRRSFIRFSTI